MGRRASERGIRDRHADEWCELEYERRGQKQGAGSFFVSGERAASELIGSLFAVCCLCVCAMRWSRGVVKWARWVVWSCGAVLCRRVGRLPGGALQRWLAAETDGQAGRQARARSSSLVVRRPPSPSALRDGAAGAAGAARKTAAPGEARG